MLEARNLSSRTYDQAAAAELAREIPAFLDPVRRLFAALRAQRATGA